MEKKAFLDTWKDIPAGNETQYTIEDVECTSDGISNRWDRTMLVLQYIIHIIIIHHLGLHCCQAHPGGPGHDLPVHQAQQWHLGSGGDQADSWQLQHHPLLQVQGHGDCTGSLPGTENIELEYNIIMTIFDRFMKPFFITKVSWVSIETSPHSYSFLHVMRRLESVFINSWKIR